MASPGHTMGSTLGQPAVGETSTGGHALSGGFWPQAGGAAPCAPADVNDDDSVDVGDVQAVAGAWRCTTPDPCYETRFDLNHDGRIDVVDIMLVVACWGQL